MTAQTTTPTLKATTRVVSGNQNKALRRTGQLPAVMYGHKKASHSISVNGRDFFKLFHEFGSTTLVNLKVDDKPAVKVLIHEVQMNPVRHEPKHVDFFMVNLKEKLQTEVPFTLTGVASVVDIEGGTLITVKDAVEIECLPENLVQELTIDISKLVSFDDTITVSDIVLPEGITVLDDLDQVLVSVVAPRTEEEMAALDEAPETTTETEFETAEGTVTDETAEGEKPSEPESK